MNRLHPARLAWTAVAVIAGCSDGGGGTGSAARTLSGTALSAVGAEASTSGVNLYAHIGPGDLQPIARAAKALVYVPNSRSASVTVIDPARYSVIRTFATGAVPQHVVPSWDLRRLWILNNSAGTLTPIDPLTGRDSVPIRVDDPYNMYYTPDGRSAIIVAEGRRRLDIRDPQTMQLRRSVRVNCRGIDHIEFTADGNALVATCEFSGQLMKMDLARDSVVGYLRLATNPINRLLHRGSMPQDIRSSPDGRTFYVADMKADGVFLVDPQRLQQVGFIHTGKGTHGLVTSRDGRYLYIANRGWNTLRAGRRGPGSVSVLEFGSNRVVADWPVPGGGSPDMGNVTADGRELWLSGRYDQEVYVFDTRTGQLTHRIPVGNEPHGLLVWPQPGRYSLGHVGNMR